MSKKRRLRGKICVYCASDNAETEDHIFSRKVFQTTSEENVRKVPACERCNNYKSKLEDYAGTVLLFGSEHPDAVEHLSVIGARRLASNRKLAKKITASMRQTYRFDNQTGYYYDAMTIDIDSASIAELLGMMARALYYWETKTLLPAGFAVNSRWIRKGDAEAVMHDLIGARGHRVHVELAGGLCDCRGLISDVAPGLSAWIFSPFGGVLTGAGNETKDDARVVGVLTGPTTAFDGARSRTAAAA